MIGTFWNVVDRWFAVLFAFYLYYRAVPRVPLLATLSMPATGAVLWYARESKTQKQWRMRHSLWHLAMCLNILFFVEQAVPYTS
eukprot:6419930-Amphidinium_carterae.1